jgi:hypothetical protein
LQVDYGARVTGTRINRVKLLDNGNVIDESGALNVSDFSKSYAGRAEPGSSHRLEIEITAESPSLRAPAILSITNCPAPPGFRS